MARQQPDKAREQIAAGLDPTTEKRIATVAPKVAADNTFKTIAEEWVGKNEREGRAPITLDKIRWLLGRAYPMIGTLPISTITPQGDAGRPAQGEGDRPCPSAPSR